MKGKSRIMRRLVLLLIVFATLSPYVLTAKADGGFSVEGDQAYDDGGGSSAATGSYYLNHTDDVAKQIVGYRFTGIKTRVSVRAGLAWLMMNRYVLQVKQVSQKRSAPSAANRWRTVFLRP